MVTYYLASTPCYTYKVSTASDQEPTGKTDAEITQQTDPQARKLLMTTESKESTFFFATGGKSRSSSESEDAHRGRGTESGPTFPAFHVLSSWSRSPSFDLPPERASSLVCDLTVADGAELWAAKGALLDALSGSLTRTSPDVPASLYLRLALCALTGRDDPLGTHEPLLAIELGEGSLKIIFVFSPAKGDRLKVSRLGLSTRRVSTFRRVRNFGIVLYDVLRISGRFEHLRRMGFDGKVRWIGRFRARTVEENESEQTGSDGIRRTLRGVISPTCDVDPKRCMPSTEHQNTAPINPSPPAATADADVDNRSTQAAAAGSAPQSMLAETTARRCPRSASALAPGSPSSPGGFDVPCSPLPRMLGLPAGRPSRNDCGDAHDDRFGQIGTRAGLPAESDPLCARCERAARMSPTPAPRPAPAEDTASQAAPSSCVVASEEAQAAGGVCRARSLTGTRGPASTAADDTSGLAAVSDTTGKPTSPKIPADTNRPQQQPGTTVLEAHQGQLRNDRPQDHEEDARGKLSVMLTGEASEANAAAEHNLLDVYYPHSVNDVLGSQSRANAQSLADWLKQWAITPLGEPTDGRDPSVKLPKKTGKKQKRKTKERPDSLDGFIVDVSGAECSSSSVEDDDGRTRPLPVMVLVGPSGSGKTSAVHAAARDTGYDVFEVHPGMRRSAKDLLTLVGEVTQNHVMAGWDVREEEQFLPGAESENARPKIAREHCVTVATDVSTDGSTATTELFERRDRKRKKGQRRTPLPQNEADSATVTRNKCFWEKMGFTRASPKPIFSTVPSSGGTESSSSCSPVPVPAELPIILAESDAPELTPDAEDGNLPQPAESELMVKVQRLVASSSAKPLLILLEEADITYEEDQTFWKAVATLAERNRRPIVITCSSRSDSSSRWSQCPSFLRV
ncbi:MAG: hypothetical protein BJ554DRAFT_6113 [Olpidium bornovanus]|uniref:AAA+ ATPase domain-containing protein n=1 Tax=Olpidium bornovanus TaxID=278681 RepID=A0A8H7ZYG3_9FUNG|nr:MAG: hypothetical protein BJ554DRAFT_6113 [Olpidium bornovanus]